MKPRGKKKREGEAGNEKHQKHGPAAGSQSWWCCRAGIQWGSQWCWDPTEHPVVLGFKGVPRAAGIPWGMQQCGDLMGTQCCGDCMGTQQCWDPMGHPVVLHRACRAVGIQWGTQSCGDPMAPSCPAGLRLAGQRRALPNSVTSGGRRTTLSEGLDLKTTNDGEPATSLGKLLRWLITLPV